MKHSLASKIVIVLLPFLLLRVLHPGAARSNNVFDYVAGQVVTVYSFVMVPLLQVGVLVAQHIILPKTIAEQAKNDDNTGKKQSSSNDNTDYIMSASFASVFTTAVRKFVLSLSELLTHLYAVNGMNFKNMLQFALFFIVMPFVRLCILRSNPSLARGDPPSLLQY